MRFPEFSKAKAQSETALLGKAFRGLRERFLEGGYPALEAYGCEQLGIRPVYVAENRPEFAEWRERLKTESGLVIANHPGGIDVPAILKTLDRKGVYFWRPERMSSDSLMSSVRSVFWKRPPIRARCEPSSDASKVFLRGAAWSSSSRPRHRF